MREWQWRGQNFGEWAFTPAIPDDFDRATVLATIDPGVYVLALGDVEELAPGVILRDGHVSTRRPLGAIAKFTHDSWELFVGSEREAAALVAKARAAVTA